MYICIHICRTPPSCTPPASRGHSIPLAVLVFPCPAKDGEAYMYVIRLMHSYIAVIHTCIWIRLRSQKHILFVGLNFDMFVGIACFISLYIYMYGLFRSGFKQQLNVLRPPPCPSFRARPRTIATQGTPKTHPRHTQDTPKAHPRHTQDTAKTHPKHTQDAPKTHPGHTQDAAKTHPIHTQDTPKTRPRHSQDTPKSHPRHTQDAHKTHPRHSQDAAKTHPRRTQDTFELKSITCHELVEALFVCWFVCLLVCLFVCLFACLFVCLVVCLFVCLFV